MICSSTPILTTLIVRRAIIGLGASGSFSVALIISAHSVLLGKHPACSSKVIRIYEVASVAGTLMGGALTDNFA